MIYNLLYNYGIIFIIRINEKKKKKKKKYIKNAEVYQYILFCIPITSA